MFSPPVPSVPSASSVHRTYGQKTGADDTDIKKGYYIHSKKLGEGGFGSVWLATHLVTEQKVAIKAMNKSKLGGDLVRVETEIEALKHLNHKNIAKLLQVIEDTENIYLVLEFCSGGELFDYLVAKRRLREDEAKGIIYELAEVLDYIHSKGFAHRDIKPENILLDKNQRIKLIDFGLTAVCRDLNSSNLHLKTCCGSPAYAAPELLSGREYTGREVDVWSTGVLLYTLLVGHLPFEDTNLQKLFQKIQVGKYYLPSYVSEDARSLVSSMLQINPKHRITVKEIRNHQWLKVGVKSNQQLVETMPSFDAALEVCHQFFPEVDSSTLMREVILDFGYKTATHWLVRNNPQVFQSLKSDINTNPSNRRQSRSNNDLSQRTETRKMSPKVVSTKRKIDFQTLKGFQVKKVSPLRSPTPEGTPSKVLVRTAAKCTPKSSESPKLVKDRVYNINPLKNKSRVLSPINNSPFRLLKNFTPKAHKSVDENCLTPKKSLLKRMLESATPTKSKVPRVLKSIYNHNITPTQYTEARDLIPVIVEIMKLKGLQCTDKSPFSLRCVLSTKNTIVLAIDLEICVYRGQCVIRRKRLTGSAADYVKICNELNGINQISDQSIAGY